MPTLNTEIERPSGTVEKLQAENDELRLRLQEAEETIAAIRSGAVDALVIEEPTGHRIYTLEGADRPYRLFVEEMQQGAATLHADGTIAWCNRQLAEILKTSQDKLVGATLHDFVSLDSLVVYQNLLWQGQTRSGRGEVHLRRTDVGGVPAFFTFNALPKDCGAAIGVLVTDLTSQRHHEQLTTAHAALRESEKRLEIELAATQQLQSVSALLLESGNPEALYQRIVDAAVSIMGSDFASMQKLYPERNAGQGELLLLAHHGFAPESIETFRWVRTDTGCTCGETLRTGARTIASDVEQASYIVGRPGLQAYRQSNIRAVQTTPLICRTNGRILGMISTHWRTQHAPTDRDLRQLDLLARQAADLLERNEAEESLRESERRFREMIDALPVAIYTTDGKGGLTHFNPAAVEFSGRMPELGTDQWCVSFKLYDSEGKPLPNDECPMAIALKEGRVIRGAEAIAERPDGTRRWFTPYPTPLRDSAGKIVGGINMLLDITERKRAEERVRRVAEFDEAVMTNMGEGLYTVDGEGRVTSMNPAAEKLFGWTFDELRGRKMHDLTHYKHRDGSPFPAEDCAGLQVLREGRTLSDHEDVFIRKGGTFFDVIYSSAPIQENGNIAGLVVVFRDVTEQKRTEAALRANEERFRTLFELGPVAVYSCDAAGVIQTFNERAGELWARTPAPGDTDERFCGSFRLYRPDGTFMPHEQCPMAEVLSGKIPAMRDAEVTIERPDGSRIVVVVNIRPLKNELGEITGAINCFYDVTERKHAEQVRAKLAAIVESSDDAIISKDLNGVISSWNRGAERLFGYTRQETVGQPVTMLIPPDHLAEEPSILERIRRGESIDHYETVRRRKDGELLDVSLTVSPIRNDQGEVVGASKIARDISHRKRNEEALRQAQTLLADRAEQLEQAVVERTAELSATNKQLEAFAYSVAHDLRAPVRSMEGFSAMLLEEAGASLSEAGQDFANRINRAAQFMDSLLMDLLTFSSTAQQRIELAPVKLETVVKTVLSRLEKDIQETNACVKTSGPWPTVLAHESTLGQVLFNLVSNALKFVSPGVSPIVHVRAEEVPFGVQPSGCLDEDTLKRGQQTGALTDPVRRERWVRVWVEDKGIGIAPAHQEQVFRLFTRLHGDQYPGTGVGLAIVQKGMERMGGRVGVESALDQGSRFWFELRRA